jgi:hypothetical protein
LPTDDGKRPTLPTAEDLPRLLFTDVASSLGIDHVYLTGAQGKSLMVETMGGGAAWLDYDNDGHSDLYLNQGGDPTVEELAGQPLDQLFRNLGQGFAKVPACRIEERGYSQGVATGDYDNDGFDDVYVTNVAGNRLYHNLGDGTFTEVTASAGVRDGRWSASAAWADLDLDGDLDLYVCNYVQYDPLHPLPCTTTAGEPRICHPKDVDHWPDECYFNAGDGSFAATGVEHGLYGPNNKALGVAVADFNNDGLPDIYVANDTQPNFLFINRGGANYLESALALGCAVDRNGLAQASMGLAVGDYDRNGWLDIYSTHFELESNTLYRNLGPQGFEDVTARVGLHEPTLPVLGFGTIMCDFDQNGTQELFVANGHIENYPNNPKHKMAPQLFSWQGTRWLECSQAAGDFFRHKQVGRGVAGADFDHDGDMDLAVVHQDTATAILRNDSQRGHWLKFRFIGRKSNRSGVGTRVTVSIGDQSYLAEQCGGGSYCSTHEPGLLLGLGPDAQECQVTIRWPTGRIQELSGVAPDQFLTLQEPE